MMLSRLLPLGLAIAFNAAVLGAGLAWLRRQAKRVSAERMAEDRGLFTLEPLPPPGATVLILVEESDGGTTEIEGVHWPHLGWTDARTLLKVEDDVLGWRWHPFRERRQDDPATWSREKLAAELERLYPRAGG